MRFTCSAAFAILLMSLRQVGGAFSDSSTTPLAIVSLNSIAIGKHALLKAGDVRTC